MTKKEKERYIDIINQTYKPIKELYIKQGCENLVKNDMNYTILRYCINIKKTNKKSTIENMMIQAIKQISQWHTDIVIHILRQQQIL